MIQEIATFFGLMTIADTGVHEEMLKEMEKMIFKFKFEKSDSLLVRYESMLILIQALEIHVCLMQVHNK